VIGQQKACQSLDTTSLRRPIHQPNHRNPIRKTADISIRDECSACGGDGLIPTDRRGSLARSQHTESLFLSAEVALRGAVYRAVPRLPQYCMAGRASAPHHASVRVLTHITKRDDCFGQFLVRVICDCGTVREIEPEALARLVGWKVTLKELTPRMRCSRCGKKAVEVVAVARPRPRGVGEVI
jgi:hypothetical protein